jgi:hypothetical protein
MRPKLGPCEGETPDSILALRLYATTGLETDKYPITYMVGSGWVSWPVGFKPQVTVAGWATLELWGAK